MPLVELDVANHVADQYRDEAAGQQANCHAVPRLTEGAQQRPTLGKGALLFVFDGRGLVLAGEGGSAAGAGSGTCGGGRRRRRKLLLAGHLRPPTLPPMRHLDGRRLTSRAEERRVGKECVSPCRSRG